MRLVGCIPVRNEAWVLGLSARVALMWCDALIIFDHASTDATPDIITDLVREYPGRVFRYREDCDRWDEMHHRQHMLVMARGAGATHIAIVDADEVLTGNLIASIGATHSTIHGIAGDIKESILQIPGYNLRDSLHRYHSNGIWANRWFSVAFPDNKILHWNGDKFHNREPMGMRLQPYRPIAQGQGGVLHLWGASERRLRAKHALYAITERLRWPGKGLQQINEMYGLHAQPLPHEARWKFAEVPAEWWAPYADLMKYLDLDAEPWQEQYCRDLIAKHGAETFAGLDLYGAI